MRQQEYPGVLIGAFGPKFINPVFPAGHPAGTQLLDLGDITQFASKPGNQIAPIFETRGALLIHELAEVVADGNIAAFGKSHFLGIDFENSVLASQGSSGQRLRARDRWLRLTGTDFKIATLFVATKDVDAFTDPVTGVTWAAMSAGTVYNQVTVGRVTPTPGGLNEFGPTNMAPGVFDTGYTYDGTGFDVAIQQITFLPVPEPSTLLLLLTGGAVLLSRAGKWRHRAPESGFVS